MGGLGGGGGGLSHGGARALGGLRAVRCLVQMRMRAMCLSRVGQLDSAVPAFDELLAKDPSDQDLAKERQGAWERRVARGAAA